MNKKKVTIILISIIIAIAAICAAAFGIRYYKQKQIDEKLSNGAATVKSYVEKFEAASDKEEKAQIYADFTKDSELKDIIDTVATDEWKADYKADKTTMYTWFVNYYNDKLDSIKADYEATDKTFADCNKTLDDLDSMQDELDQETVLSKDDVSSTSENITESIEAVNGDMDQIKTTYTDTYNSYLVEDVDSASKSDLNTAIDNLNALSEEVSGISEDFFSELIGNIQDTAAQYADKVAAIEKEEAEKAKAAEEARKQQEAAAAASSSDSSSTTASTNNSSSSSGGDYGQSSWKYTGRNDNGETCNAPIVMYKARANGLDISWSSYGEYCMWSADENYAYVCDTQGNVINIL